MCEPCVVVAEEENEEEACGEEGEGYRERTRKMKIKRVARNMSQYVKNMITCGVLR